MASFQIFLGRAKFFLNFSMPPDYWKIGKKQHFICSDLTLFIAPFFLSLFFSSFFPLFFFFSSFSFFFSFFFFPWGGGGDGPPSPPQMTPLIKGGGKQGETVMRLIGWKWNVNLRVISIQVIWNWSLCKDLTDRDCVQRKEKRPKDRTLWYTHENAGRWSGMWLNKNWLCSIQEIGSN